MGDIFVIYSCSVFTPLPTREGQGGGSLQHLQRQLDDLFHAGIGLGAQYAHDGFL